MVGTLPGEGVFDLRGQEDVTALRAVVVHEPFDWLYLTLAVRAVQIRLGCHILSVARRGQDGEDKAAALHGCYTAVTAHDRTLHD